LNPFKKTLFFFQKTHRSLMTSARRWDGVVAGMVNANNSTDFVNARNALLRAFQTWLAHHEDSSSDSSSSSSSNSSSSSSDVLSETHILCSDETRLAGRELLFLRMMDARTLSNDDVASSLLKRIDAEMARCVRCVREYHSARSVVLSRLSRIYASMLPTCTTLHRWSS
jgi:hypothetical protein